jgi:pimeloyl-ACP methyl ester carboxylesterase
VQTGSAVSRTMDGMDSFSNDGFDFDVTDTPAGEGTATGEAVVLLHGFPADRHSWDAMTPALTAAGYRVLAPDQRGYSPGARPRSRRAYTTAQLAGDVLALADQAGLQRFHLVGHDWGAALAWYLAGHHPERLISVAALSVPHPDAFLSAMLRSSQGFRSWYMAAFQTPAVPELLFSRLGRRTLRASLMRGGLNRDSADRYAARIAEPAAIRGPLNWYRALPFSVRDHTGPVELPALFLRGDGDPYISRTAAELCGRYVTGPYRYEVLAGASHWLPETAPDRVAPLLVEHFGGVTTRLP